MENMYQLAEATPAQISRVPVQFGKHVGKYLFEIPHDYLNFLSEKLGVDLVDKAEKAKEILNELDSNIGNIEQKDIVYPQGLWEWQAKAFSKFYNMPFGGLLAAAGSGKSRVMVEIMKTQGIRNAVIICPLAVFSSWENQFKQWAGLSVAYTTKPGKKIFYLRHDPARIHIINFHALLNPEILETIIDIGFEWLIIDESHNIKNHKKYTKQGSGTLSIAGAALHVASSAKKRYIITGTPKERYLFDLFNQITFLDHGKAFGYDFYKFRRTHFIKGFDGFSYSVNPFMEKKIKDVINDYCIVVRPEDVKGMPPVVAKEHVIELSSEQVKLYKELKKEAQIQIQLLGKNVTITALFKIVEVLKLHQICGGAIKTEEGIFVFKKNPKLDYLFEQIKSPETETPPVIFAWYKHEHALIIERAEKENMNFGLIAGGRNDRIEVREQFMAGELDGIVIQQQAGGVGMDGLQQISRDMFVYSQNYSRTLREQAIARLKRGGAIGSIVLNDLLTSCDGSATADGLIMTSINKKDKDFRDFFYG